ncbi:MAG TPA: 2-oxoglutarate and iron-dependent oxygenase domain-containing protein [Naasia sp.]
MPLTIPVLDIDRDPAEVGREIDETLRTVGFFQIVGHGVRPDTADACWNAARAFFDLPLDAKEEVDRGDGLYGYFPMRSESLAKSRGDTAPGDLKESFNMGPLAGPAHRDADADEAALFAPNRWPSALPEMRTAWERYFAEMSRLADRLMSIFARGLDLPADFFAQHIDASPRALRAINYPAQPLPVLEGQLRAGVHTDYGTLTILRQETGRGGLQVHDGRSDAWVDVPAVDGAFVINIGDLMARWTNDRWTSTLHRVINPDAGSAVSTRRQSMPFFHNANYSALVEALPTCVGPGEQPRYEPVLAGPHLAGKSRKSVAPS